MSLRRYGSYKDSGVEWLGEVPSHWTTVPIKAVATWNDEVLSETTDPEAEIDYLEISGVSAEEGITATTLMSFADAPSRARRRVHSGDVLISTVRTYLRAIAPVSERFSHLIVSTGFAVLRPRNVDGSFLGYAARSEPLIAQVISRSVGVSYPAINASDLVRICVALPPPEEQRAIAAYLERETAKIDALVEAQRRLIELLKEKRQTVISHAVTKGLDPSAPMKDAGVEWLGEVPAHWGVMRAKHLFEKSELPSPPEAEVVTCFRDGQVTLRRNRREDGFTVAVLEVGYQGIKPGQLVLHSMDAFAGAIGVSDSEGKCSPEYLVCEPRCVDVTPQYYGRLLRLMALRGFILAICPSVRERAPRIRFPDFSELLLPVPPSGEQASIVEHITRETHKLMALQSVAQHAMEFLAERRAALISAAVTGKIDVRGLAAVPEEAEAA